MAALMFLSVTLAGAGTVAATCTDDTCEKHTDIDNDGIDIDDSCNTVIDDSEDNDVVDMSDFLTLGLDLQ